MCIVSCISVNHVTVICSSKTINCAVIKMYVHVNTYLLFVYIKQEDLRTITLEHEIRVENVRTQV